jgi:predicted peroxiredoxin
VRGLTILVANAAPERLRAALTLAAAQAALGGRARVFCQGDAVAALRPPIRGTADAAHATAGLPTLAELAEEALGLGVELIACQSGLALTGIKAATLDPRIAFGGPVSILQTLGEDRLIAI